MFSLVGGLVVERAPGWSVRIGMARRRNQDIGKDQIDLLEEENMGLRLVDLVVLPAKTLKSS